MSHAELKQLVNDRLEGRASPLFLDRVGAVLDAAKNGNIQAACTKVGKMVSLFVDESLGEELARDLRIIAAE